MPMLAAFGRPGFRTGCVAATSKNSSLGIRLTETAKPLHDRFGTDTLTADISDSTTIDAVFIQTRTAARLIVADREFGGQRNQIHRFAEWPHRRDRIACRVLSTLGRRIG
jgi:hypothetical protein